MTDGWKALGGRAPDAACDLAGDRACELSPRHELVAQVGGRDAVTDAPYVMSIAGGRNGARPAR